MFSDLPIETAEIPESLDTREEACRNIVGLETTSHQTKDSEMFLTRREEIISTDKCSQSMEIGVNSMQNEMNMLSIPFSCANNALIVNKLLLTLKQDHIIYVNPATGCYIENLWGNFIGYII